MTYSAPVIGGAASASGSISSSGGGAGRAPSVVGRDALLDFDMADTIEGAALTSREVEELLAGTEEMALIRGRSMMTSWFECARPRSIRMSGTS